MPFLVLLGLALPHVLGGQLVRRFEFARHPAVQHVDCRRIVEEDCSYTKRAFSTRIVKLPQPGLDLSCEAIRRRVVRYSEYPVIDNAVAFARVVDQDYDFLEEQLAFNYHPEHAFCFALDAKQTDSQLDARLRKLEACLPNVVLTRRRFSVSGAGAFMSHAFRECWRSLLASPSWTYVLDLQTHDVVVKTAPELSAIVDVLNGSNAIQVSACQRCGPAHEGWYLNGLALHANASHFPPDSMMQFASGLVQALVSRAAVDFLVNSLSLDKYLANFELDVYGIDELFLATLQQTDALRLPGGTTARCLRERRPTQKIVRYSNWDCSENATNCASGRQRHCICLLGVEELPAIAALPFIMLPSFDYAAVSCVGELLYNRTYGFSASEVRADAYANVSSTRFHAFMQRPNATPAEFDCSLGIEPRTYDFWNSNWFERRRSGLAIFKACDECEKVFQAQMPVSFPNTSFRRFAFAAPNLDSSVFLSYEFFALASLLSLAAFAAFRKKSLLREALSLCRRLRQQPPTPSPFVYHNLSVLGSESSRHSDQFWSE